MSGLDQYDAESIPDPGSGDMPDARSGGFIEHYKRIWSRTLFGITLAIMAGFEKFFHLQDGLLALGMNRMVILLILNIFYSPWDDLLALGMTRMVILLIPNVFYSPGASGSFKLLSRRLGRPHFPPADVEMLDVESKQRQDDVYHYKMNHPRRGLAIILNNKIFDRRTGMNERNGTDVDAAHMYQQFLKLGFEVRLYHNQTTTEMLKILTLAARDDHSKCDCFAVAILSHGDEGVVYGTDATIRVELLSSPFKGDRCISLAGKPKLFFIQACRGSELDHGAHVVADGDDDGDVTDAPQLQRIPSEADFLFAYSTVPGYFSWRNSTKGSWFVQALAKTFEKYGNQLEILALMTRVNRLVAYDFESNAAKPEMTKKKQIPCIVSMLTKELYFKPKK